MNNSDMLNIPWLEDAKAQLKASLEQGRMPHALMIHGPEGLGKGQMAEMLVNGLLCQKGSGEACGECRSCLLIPGGAHPDRFVLTPAEDKRQIVVDQVRELINRLVLTTTISPRKVALVHPAESMNIAAANALLKTLEEPPGDTVLVLMTHDPSRLPVTIRSRCRMLPVNPPAMDVALAWLRSVSDVTEDDAKLALEAALDSPLTALRIVQDEELPRYRDLREKLEGAIGKPSRAGALAASISDWDPVLTWRWLSLAASRGLRSALGAGGSDAWPATQYTLPTDKLAQLQRKADWAVKQLGRGLRQDLLLQEWLLEWSRLPAREAIRGAV